MISGGRKTWKSIVYRLSIPYMKELEPEVSWILEYLHTQKYLVDEISLNMKFIYIRYKPYRHT